MKRSIIVLVAVMILATGCTSVATSSGPPTHRAATATATPTATATSAATATATVSAPDRVYSGTATCANLLNAHRLNEYLADGSVVTSDSYGRKIMTEAAENSYPLGLATFITYGGIACGWGGGYENQIIFGYGPITDEQATKAKAYLVKHHLKKAKNSAFERYNGGSADWAFGNGYWAYAGDNGGGNVLSEVVAHAPHWSKPGHDTKPTPTSLTTRTVKPATAPYLSTDGLGGLRLGAPIPVNNPFVAFHAHTCFASWLAKSPYGDARLGRQALDVLTASHTSGSRLTGILLRDDTIPTKSGIRVGDSLATLEKAFATFNETVQFDESTGYIIGDKHGKVVFDVALTDSPTGSYLAGQIRSISLFPASVSGDELSADHWAPCSV